MGKILLDDGSILLYKYNPQSWLEKIVQKAICRVTDSKWVHCAIYLKKTVFESTVWWKGLRFYSGIKISSGAAEQASRIMQADKILAPVKKYTEQQIIKMQNSIYEDINYRKPYNILKLISLAYIYPRREDWNNKWLPFDREFFGEVCSTFVDNLAWEVGVDLLKEYRQGVVAPCDFLKSPLLMEREASWACPEVRHKK